MRVQVFSSLEAFETVVEMADMFWEEASRVVFTEEMMELMFRREWSSRVRDSSVVEDGAEGWVRTWLLFG